MAVFTNVTSDHLDRHGTLEAYRAVKRRLAEMADPAGALVVNLDDPVDGRLRGSRRTADGAYRLDRPAPGGLGSVDGWIVADGVERLALAGPSTEPAVPAADGRILPVDELRIPGRHNVSNALAAVAVALLFGIAAEAIRAAAGAFGGVEHRLETVGVVDGVRFVNDSQGTQPDAVIAALRAFDPPIVLIAGGRDKGIDLTDLGPVVAERAAAAVLIGESGPGLDHRFRAAGLARTERAGDARGGRPPGGRDRRGAAHRAAGGASRPDRASCDGPAQPGGGQLRHVRGLRGPWPGVQGRRRRSLAEEGSR